MNIDLLKGIRLSVEERLQSHDRLNQGKDFPANVSAIHDRIAGAKADRVVRYARHWAKIDAAIATSGYPAVVRYLEEVLKLTEPTFDPIAFCDPVIFTKPRPIFFDEFRANEAREGGENAD